MTLKKDVKDTVKVGVASMAGMAAFGALQKVPGMPTEAANVSQIASSGLVLANIGQLSKTAMGLTKGLQEQAKPIKKKNNVLDKIW